VTEHSKHKSSTRQLLRSIKELLEQEGDEDEDEDIEETEASDPEHGHIKKLATHVEELSRTMRKKYDEILNVLKDIERNTRPDRQGGGGR
jgi:hypothetical protein